MGRLAQQTDIGIMILNKLNTSVGYRKYIFTIKYVLRLFMIIISILILPIQGFAISQSDLDAVRRNHPFYDPKASCSDGSCSPCPNGGTGGTGGTTDSGGTYVAWNSGLQPPYIMEQFVIQVLKYIASFKGVPEDQVVTQEHTLALLAWAWGEGGDIANSGLFNLFNSGALRNTPEAIPRAAGGVDGRQSYISFDVGVKATGGNILGGGAGNPERYSRVVNALLDKNTTASQVLDAYAHYSRYPNNSWWAAQNEIDGEDAYYQKLLGYLRGFQKDYERAATIIGTPEFEQQTGARDPSKLQYNGTGIAPLDDPSDSSSSSSSGSCNNSTINLAGVECPAGNLETLQVGNTTYYKLPEAPNGEYTIYASQARRYGSKELVCAIYSASKAYKTKYGGKSKVSVGDLNAGYPHKSHRWGIAVDIDAPGSLYAADHTKGNYSSEATVDFGKLWVDTGLTKNIWWCEPDGDNSIQQISDYAKQSGKPITIKCITGHENHFHVDINVPKGDSHTP